MKFIRRKVKVLAEVQQLAQVWRNEAILANMPYPTELRKLMPMAIRCGLMHEVSMDYAKAFNAGCSVEDAVVYAWGMSRSKFIDMTWAGPGPQGAQGPAGMTGAVGYQGVQGVQGAQGGGTLI